MGRVGIGHGRGRSRALYCHAGAGPVPRCCCERACGSLDAPRPSTILVVPAGARISVYWEGGEEWYESTVVAHQAVYDHTGAIVAFKHKCEYENGIISHDLSESEYEVLEWPEGHGPHDEPFGEEAEEEEEEEGEEVEDLHRRLASGPAGTIVHMVEELVAQGAT